MKQALDADTIVILGGTADNDTKCWAMKNGEWILNQEFAMPVGQLYSFGVCFQGQDVFITGGTHSGNNNPQSKRWKVAFPRMQWTPLPDLTVAR